MEPKEVLISICFYLAGRRARRCQAPTSSVTCPTLLRWLWDRAACHCPSVRPIVGSFRTGALGPTECTEWGARDLSHAPTIPTSIRTTRYIRTTCVYMLPRLSLRAYVACPASIESTTHKRAYTYIYSLGDPLDKVTPDDKKYIFSKTTRIIGLTFIFTYRFINISTTHVKCLSSLFFFFFDK